MIHAIVNKILYYYVSDPSPAPPTYVSESLEVYD